MSEFVTAVGLVFVIEGLLYALAPGMLKSLTRLIQELPEDKLRVNGMWAVGIGVLIVWLARSYIA